MGQHGLSSLLQMAGMPNYINHLPADNLQREFDFALIAAMNLALEEMYGTRGGRGMALRIGRAAFAQGIKGFGAMKAIADPAYRVLPVEKRIEYGLRGLAAILSNFSDQQSWVEAEKHALLFASDVSPYAWGRLSEQPVCHMMVGIIQEALRWASNGYEFYVRETACHATGSDQCIFRINKRPIGEGQS